MSNNKALLEYVRSRGKDAYPGRGGVMWSETYVIPDGEPFAGMSERVYRLVRTIEEAQALLERN